MLLQRERKETFWALKDVDLGVKHGECFGNALDLRRHERVHCFVIFLIFDVLLDFGAFCLQEPAMAKPVDLPEPFEHDLRLHFGETAGVNGISGVGF